MSKLETKEVAVSKEQRNITDIVLDRVNAFKETGTLKFPKDYSPENALKASYLLLQETKDRNGKPVLESCSKESIANALLKMVVLGLNPIKKQGNFIAYGDKLSFDIEYAGNIALAKRFGLKNIKGVAVMKGDEFSFENTPETGRKKITKHVQTLDSIGEFNILGAYAVMEFENGTFDVEIMSMKQIQAAWNQGASKGNSPAHKNFPDQMAIKTVINRACKLIIRTSDDSTLYGDEGETEISQDTAKENVATKVASEANKKNVSFEEAESVDITNETNQTPPKETTAELTEDEKADIAKEEAELAEKQGGRLF